MMCTYRVRYMYIYNFQPPRRPLLEVLVHQMVLSIHQATVEIDSFATTKSVVSLSEHVKIALLAPISLSKLHSVDQTSLAEFFKKQRSFRLEI